MIRGCFLSALRLVLNSNLLRRLLAELSGFALDLGAFRSGSGSGLRDRARVMSVPVPYLGLSSFSADVRTQKSQMCCRAVINI